MSVETCCVRFFGVLLCLVSTATCGFGIADVIVTWKTCSTSSTDASSCSSLPNSYLLSWIAPGIWASIPIFATGCITIWVSTRSPKTSNKGWLVLFSILSCLMFAPALIVVSVLDIYYTYPGGLPAFPNIELGILLAIGSGGVLLLGIVFILFVYACRYTCCSRQKEEDTESIKKSSRPTISTVNASGMNYQQQQHSSGDGIDRSSSAAAYRWLSSGPSPVPLSKPPGPKPNYYGNGAPPTRSPSVGAGGLYIGVDSGNGFFQIPRPGMVGTDGNTSEVRSYLGPSPFTMNYD